MSKSALLAGAAAVAALSLPPGVIFMAPTTIEALRDSQQEIQAESEALVAAADEAGRDLTDEETDAIEANRAKIEKLGRQIAARAAVAPPAQPGRRTTAEVQNGQGRNTAPATARTDPRTGGFRHLGEFAACVRSAAMRDDGAHTRLFNALGMNEGVGEDGGFLVPAEFRDGIMKVVEGEESLLSRCDMSTTARNAVTQNLDETAPWATTGIVSYWEGEGQAAAASGLKPNQTTLRLNKLFARVDVTDELLEDAPQLDNYLRVKAPEVMTSVINLAIIQGNGSGKPLGFMNSGCLVTVAAETSQPTDTVQHRNIVKMWSRLYAPCRARAVWLVNQDVEPQFHLMSFRDGTTTPVPVYLPPNGLSESPYGTLMGRPVIPVQGMETLGDLGDIAFVDLTKYRAVTKAGGARVDTSIHLKFDTDETVFRFIFRLAGAPWWSKAITPRDGSNTLSPFVTLATR